MTLDIYISNHPVLSQLPRSNDTRYHTDEYMHQLSAYIPILINSSSVKTVPIEPQHTHMYAGDFYGYLRQQIPSLSYDLYWLCTRLSGMNGPTEFGPQHTHAVLVQDDSILSEIIAAQNTTQGSAL